MTVIFITLGAIGAISLTSGCVVYLALRLVGAYFDRQSEQARLGKTELVNPEDAGEVLGAVKSRKVKQ